MGKWKHILTEIDEEAKTAICESCGPVVIKFNERWKCLTSCQNFDRKYYLRKKEAFLQKRYSISLADLAQKTKDQDGKCYICGLVSILVVDHCHDTGKVRALLCRPCNVALGLAKDSPEILRKAADYLEHFSATF